MARRGETFADVAAPCRRRGEGGLHLGPPLGFRCRWRPWTMVRDVLAYEERQIAAHPEGRVLSHRHPGVGGDGAVLAVQVDDRCGTGEVDLATARFPEVRVEPAVECVVNREEVANVVPLFSRIAIPHA